MNSNNIFEQLDNIPNLFKDYLNNYLSRIKEDFGEDVISVILFGSVARGKWTLESDIDLLLIFSNDSTNLTKRLKKILFNFYEFNQLIDKEGNQLYGIIQEVPLLQQDLNNFRTLFYDIAIDGILIFDRNNVGLEFINRIKRRIKDKGLKRIFLGEEDFYWKRKDVKFGEIVEL